MGPGACVIETTTSSSFGSIQKIVDGRIGGFFKDVALLDQPYAKDDKQTITQLLGSAKVVRFAQVEIG